MFLDPVRGWLMNCSIGVAWLRLLDAAVDCIGEAKSGCRAVVDVVSSLAKGCADVPMCRIIRCT